MTTDAGRNLLEARAAPREAPLWRTAIFCLFAALFAFASFTLLEGVTEGLMPWVIIGCPGCMAEVAYDPTLHRWHSAQHGALIAILLGGSLTALLWQPVRRPLLLQFYTLAKLAFLAIFALAFLWQPFTTVRDKPGIIGVFLFVLVILAAAYPAPRRLFDFSLPGPMSRPLLGITLAAAALLAWPTWHAVQMQIAGTATDQWAVSLRWAESAAVHVVLVLAGLMAATRKPGWRSLGWLLALAYAFLGAAAITVPDGAGSWGVAGGILALFAAAAYAATLLSGADNGSAVR